MARLRRASREFVSLIPMLVVVWMSVQASTPAGANQTRAFRLHAKAEFLKGTLDGIGVDSLGILRLADRVERLAEVEEPFLLSAAAHPEGWVVGTGNAGRVLLVTRGGEVRTLYAADEPEIFAVHAAADGTVYAGSSPNGKIYRIADGQAVVHFDPQETYIWGLATTRAGDLLAATGTEGRLYKVDKEGQGQVFFDSEDTHIRALKVLDNGEILLGTAGEGLILKLSVDGSPRTLYDAPHPEVVAFAAAPNGDCFAALLASEASLVSLSRRPQEAESNGGGNGNGEQDGTEGEAQVEVMVTVGEEAETAPEGSRPPGFAGARSEILRISPAGLVESLTSFQEETVYALRWHRGRLWIGTGLEGKVFSLRNHRPVLEKDVDERQVVAILEDSPGPAFATTNAAALYRISDQTERRGVYTSPTLDAEQISRFGTLWWQGETPAGTRVQFSFRSGMSSEPDRTWTVWSPPNSEREVSLANLPSGRYVQWRAEFEASEGRSPSLSEVTLSYRQSNLPPRIKSLTVLDPGQIVVPANFNPAQQAYEPAHPNRDGIFSTLEPVPVDQQRRWKTLWKRGYRTLRWEAEDPNGDDLVYGLWFRAAGSDRPWLPVVEDLRSDHYSFDSSVLPDGRYRFRLQAFDRQRSDDQERKEVEEVSEPVLVDHTNPVLVSSSRADGRLQIVVEDHLNPLREAVFSVDATQWRPATTADGLLDGQRETLLLEIPEPGELLLLRLTDAAFNVVTIDLTRSTQP